MAIDSKNNVLIYLSKLLEENQSNIIYQNQIDIDNLSHSDDSMRDRLKIDEDKIKIILACVSSATFYDGTTWENPYYKYWLEKFQDKPIPVPAPPAKSSPAKTDSKQNDPSAKQAPSKTSGKK